jgi:phage terminase large subunit-like protein
MPTATRSRSTRKKLAPFTVPHWREWVKRLVLDNGEPWESEDFQDELVEIVFSGIREILFVVPEENTKTTTVAGLCLYQIANRNRAKVIATASARDQAREGLYGQASGLVEASGLDAEFVCQEGFLRIKHPGTRSRLQITAAEAGTGDGAIPNFVAVDELHRHKDLSYYRTLAGKLRKRNAQLVAISTAGEPGSEFELLRAEFRARASETRVEETHGIYISSTSALIEWCVPAEGDPNDLALVKRANPFSGITVESLQEKFEAPSFDLAHWKRMVCNQPTRAEASAISEVELGDLLARGDGRQAPEGTRVLAGLDVGWKYDETGLLSLYAKSPTDRLLRVEATLVPPRRRDEQLDPDEIIEAVRALHKRNPIEYLVMDVAGARDVASAIEKLGIEVVDRQQTNPRAVEDYQRFMEAMRKEYLAVADDADGNFARHAGNAVARMLPLGDSKFERPKEGRLGREQSRRVIDLLVAGAMVNSVYAAELETEKKKDPLPMVAVV